MPIIDIARLDEPGEDFEGEETILLFEAGDEPDICIESPVRYALHAQLAGSELIVTGAVAVQARFLCCRCAEAFSAEVRDPAFAYAQDLRELTGASAPAGPARRAGPAHGRKSPHPPLEMPEFVDLTPDVRESILLAFPSHPVCGPNCKGLCPRCGVNLNRETCDCEDIIEGRWDMLDGLNDLT